MNNAILWAISLIFLLLPTGTSPPLLAMGVACSIWLFSGWFLKVASDIDKMVVLPVILYIFLHWLGMLYSLDRETGMDFAMKTKYWIAFLITAGCTMRNDGILLIVKALWVGLVAGAILAMGQMAGLLPFIKADYPGFGIVYTLLTMYLVVGILMAAFYFKRIQNIWWKLGLVFLIAIFLFHLSVLRGRGGYVVFILASPIIASHLMYRFSLFVKILVTFSLIFALFSSPVVRGRIADTVEKIKTNRVKSIQGELIKLMPRTYMAEEALKAMKRNSIFGVGTGGLYKITEAKGRGIKHPHNNILYMGASFGLVGIASLFWLFGTMFIISWRQRQTPLGYFVLCSCLVLFLGGMFDTQILNTGTLLMLVLCYGFLCQLNRSPKSSVNSGAEERCHI
ncbi:MAG: O-antigen ligase family protein [Desulfobacter sp.]